MYNAIRNTAFWLFVALVVSAAHPLHAQDFETVRISGTVLDTQQGLPIAGVNVFVSGTTIGGSTNAEGVYSFEYPFPPSEFKLVASMVGFELQSRTIVLNNRSQLEEDFQLPAKVYALGEIAVVADTKERRKLISLLEHLLFSTTYFGSDCTIINTQALRLSYDEQSESMVAYATEPLVVENKALGYQIETHDFFLSGREDNMRWGGEMLFSELEPKSIRQARQWTKNRDVAYQGSTRHFIRSVFNDQIEESGFKIFQVDAPGIIIRESEFTPAITLENAQNVVGTDKSALFRMSFSKVLLVMYMLEDEPTRYQDYADSRGLKPNDRTGLWNTQRRAGDIQKSWLVLNDIFVLVDQTGSEFGETAFQRYGYWAWERMGEMLPSDYSPH